MKKHYKALILDMDGTLLNSHKMVLDSINALADEAGITLTPAHYKAAFGCSADTLMADLGFADPAAGSARWRAIMEGMLHEVPLFPGVDAVLAAPIRRGVVTSQTREELAKNLTRLSIADRFEFTVTVDETPFQKPHPRPLLYCIEQLGITPGEALFVGDSDYDYGCAQAAGVDFGVATWGAEPGAVYPNAKFCFERPEDMLSVM